MSKSIKNNLNNSSCFNNMDNKSSNEINTPDNNNNLQESENNTPEENNEMEDGQIEENNEIQDNHIEENLNNIESQNNTPINNTIRFNLRTNENVRNFYAPLEENPRSVILNQILNSFRENININDINVDSSGEPTVQPTGEPTENESRQINDRNFINNFLNSNEFENQILSILNRSLINNDNLNNAPDGNEISDNEEDNNEEEDDNEVEQEPILPAINNFSSFISNMISRRINYYDQANPEFKQIIDDNKESINLYNYCCYLLFKHDQDFCGRFTDEYLKKAHAYLQEHYSVILNQIEDNDFDFFQNIFHPIIESLYQNFIDKKTKYCIEILNQYITDEKFDTNQNEECCICKIGDDEKTVKLKCGHKMHYDCVKTWFIENTACPICREEHDPIKIEENKKKLEIEKERFELDLMQKEDKINYNEEDNEEDYEDMPPLVLPESINRLIPQPNIYSGSNFPPLRLPGFSTFIENDTLTDINNLRRPNILRSNRITEDLLLRPSVYEQEDSLLFGTTTAPINFHRRLNPSDQILQSDNIITNDVTESNFDNTQDDNVMQDSDDEIENNNIAEENANKRKFDSESSEDD